MAEAGWYQDPQGAPGVLRWFDGSTWTEHTTAPPAKARGSRVVDGVFWALLGSWILGAVSLILPWLSITVLSLTVSTKGIDTGDGKSYAVLLVIAAASWVLHIAKMGRSFMVLSLLTTMTMTGLALYDIVHVTGTTFRVEVGLYAAVAAGAIGMVAAALETRRAFARS